MELDLVIVVNMFLTGFDATTLNTLWVDKNLRQHGLIQAFSRTNRILNKVKTFGNIVCFRDLKERTDEAIALFGDKEAGGIILLKTFDEYYNGYKDNKNNWHQGYKDLVSEINNKFPLGPMGLEIVGENNKKDFINLYGKILRTRNILTSFDDFENRELLSDRDLQTYQSTYLKLYQEFRRLSEADKEYINDDIIFEIELVRQIEVNIDYILMLIEKYKDSNCKDKEILTDIDMAISSSIELRNKRDLIENFIKQISSNTEVDGEWREFLNKSRERDIDNLIKEDNLKEEETKQFIENSFRDGVLKTTGVAIDNLMPPVSRFGGGRGAKKQDIIDKLLIFFEKYFGLM